MAGRRLALLLVFAWPLRALGAENKQPADPGQLFRGGEEALRSGNLAAAEQAFRSVLERDPSSAGAHANLGVIYMRRSDWPRAVRELKQAERLAPNVPGIRLNIGLVYYRQSRFGDAIQPFSSVLKDQPGSEQARYLLGLCYFLTDKYNDAYATLETLWPKYSGSLEYLYVVGIAAGKSGRADQEKKAFDKLVAEGRDSPELHLFVGKGYLARDLDDEALREFAAAVRARDDLPFAHYYLGVAYRKKQQFEAAKREFRRSAELQPTSGFEFEQLGQMALLDGDAAEAQRWFEAALNRDARLAASRYGLAQALQHEGKYRAALGEIDKIGPLSPDSHAVHYLRARLLMKLERPAEAKQELERARIAKEQADEMDRRMLGQSVPDPQLANGR